MFRGLALDEELLGGHGKCPHRMNVRENRAVVTAHHGVTQHTHVRLNLSKLIIGREEFKAHRRVQVSHHRLGFFPDDFVAAAGVSDLSRCIR
jgi:hypothetical protein